MSEKAAKEAGRISRLDLVRSGGAQVGALKLPKRGRALVEIEAVVPDPRNERKAFRGIEELAASIKRLGIIEAPTVVPREDGLYMLSTGERRWRAAKLAGLKQIPVIIGDPEEERTRRVKSLVSNVQREDLSAIELAHALREMKDDNPDVKTNRDLAGLIGKSEQWVGQMLKILSLPPLIQDKIRQSDRVIPYDSVVEIARVGDKKAQTELLAHVLNGANVRQVREKAKGVKPGRAGKIEVRSTQKLLTSKGWVIIHCKDDTPSKADFLTALEEASKAIDGMNL